MIIYTKVQRAIWLFFSNSIRAPYSKDKGLMAPTSNSFSVYFLLIIVLRDSEGIVPSILVQCLVLAELSAHLPAFYLVVPFLITNQAIHHSIYVASYVVSNNNPKFH